MINPLTSVTDATKVICFSLSEKMLTLTVFYHCFMGTKRQIKFQAIICDKCGWKMKENSVEDSIYQILTDFLTLQSSHVGM